MERSSLSVLIQLVMTVRTELKMNAEIRLSLHVRSYQQHTCREEAHPRDSETKSQQCSLSHNVWPACS